MASATTKKYVDLALSLPKPLLRYFARFPPSNKEAQLAAFMPQRHPVTLRHQEPVYSIRRRKLLYKLADEHQVTSFLPVLPTDKKKVMRGTLKFKGTISQRNASARKKATEEAISGMDEKIKLWRANKHEIPKK